MKLRFTVSKEKGGKWYAHEVGFPGIPSMITGRHTFGDKKYALHNAAIAMGLPYKEYMQLRRKCGSCGTVEDYDPTKGKVT